MLEVDWIYCGDATEVLRMAGSSTIDLAVTSPPYNLGVKYDVCNDWMDWPDYYAWCEEWLAQIYRVLKPDGRFCLNHYLSCGTAAHRSAPAMNLNKICEDMGFQHHGVILWDDRTLTKFSAWGSYLSARAPYANSPFEIIDILYKDRWKKDQKGESTITKEEFIEAALGIWKFAPEKNRKGKRCPAPFPVALPKRCINFLTYKGDLVLDPFNGDGATCVAAAQIGRHYIGIDISPTYCETATERVKTEGVMKDGSRN